MPIIKVSCQSVACTKNYALVFLFQAALEIVTGKNRTQWSKTPREFDRVQVHNIIRREEGPTTFATSRIDYTKHVFSKLLGYGDMDAIVNFALAKARRNGDENFPFDVEMLEGFLSLCIAGSAYKGRGELLKSLWRSHDGRPLFVGTMSHDTFLSICDISDSTTKKNEDEEKIKISFNKFDKLIWESMEENF